MNSIESIRYSVFDGLGEGSGGCLNGGEIGRTAASRFKGARNRQRDITSMEAEMTE